MFILSRPLLNIGAKLEQTLPAQPCLLCGALSRHGLWCAACDAGLPYLVAAHCPVCALPVPDGRVCGRCLKQPPHFGRTVAVFAYAFPLDKLMQAFKFNEQLLLADSFADKLAQRISERPDCVVPMPLHPARLRERGFNQSLELARRVARQLELPLLPHACERIRDTPAQSALKWRERSKNVRKAFVCTQDVAGKHVAMVDDVMTSGASLNELAAALRRAGAREVSAWVVARTLPHIRAQTESRES
ncbi:MAG: ComF family protein [Nitrosomonadales bacterium]|nr:ComF family protein [Nitrosomonadales bacterium]